MIPFLRLIPACLLSILCLCQFAEAAPKRSQKTNRAKQTTTQTQPKKKQTAKETAKEQVPTGPNAPDKHPQAYKNFIALLEDIQKKNGYDLSGAYYIVLQTTQDEFAVEEWMQQAAKDGNTVAIMFMAQKDLFRIPQERFQSPETRKAVAQLKLAADSKYAPAMQEYSECMRRGIGTIQNEPGADRMLAEACRSGCFETRFDWLIKTNRLESYEDMERPEVKSEIDRGNHYILHHLSIKAPDGRSIIQGLVKAADKGSGIAYYELSELNAKKDIALSFNLLKEAVKLNNPDAMYRMGMYMIDPPIHLETNVGPVRNPAKGIMLLKLATLLGEPLSRVQLARMYYFGSRELPKDEDKAYRHAAFGAAVHGQKELTTAQGFMHLTGAGTPQNTAKGIELLELAAKHQDAYAQALLGYAYFKGIGVSADRDKAIICFQDAATHGYPAAFLYLALMHDKNSGHHDANKLRYYTDHAEREFPGKSQTYLRYLQNLENGLILYPFRNDKF